MSFDVSDFLETNNLKIDEENNVLNADDTYIFVTIDDKPDAFFWLRQIDEEKGEIIVNVNGTDESLLLSDIETINVITDIQKFLGDAEMENEAGLENDDNDLTENTYYDLQTQLVDMNNILYKTTETNNECNLNSHTDVLKARFKYLYEMFTGKTEIGLQELPANLLVASCLQGRYDSSWLLPVTSDLRILYDINASNQSKKANPQVLYKSFRNELNAWKKNEQDRTFTALPFLQEAPYVLNTQQKNQVVDITLTPEFPRITSILENKSTAALTVVSTTGKPVQNVLQEYLLEDVFSNRNKFTLNGYLALPPNVQYFSLINLRGTDLLLKANFQRNYCNLWQILKTKSVADYLLQNRATWSSSKKSYTAFVDDSILSPKQYLQNNEDFLALYTSGNRSLQKCLQFLTIYKVGDNLQEDLQETIAAFLEASIKKYTTMQKKQLKVPEPIADLINGTFFNKTLQEDYEYGGVSNSEILNEMILRDQGTTFTAYCALQGTGTGLQEEVGFQGTTTLLGTTKLQDSRPLKEAQETQAQVTQAQETQAQVTQAQVEACSAENKVIAKRYFNANDLKFDNNNEHITYDTEYDPSYYAILEKYKLWKVAVEDRVDQIAKQLQNKDPQLDKLDALTAAKKIINSKKVVKDGVYAILQEKPQTAADGKMQISYFIRKDSTWIPADMTSATNSDKPAEICIEYPKCLPLKNECLPATKVITILTDENLKQQQAQLSNVHHSLFHKNYELAHTNLSAFLRMRKFKMFACDKKSAILAAELLFQGDAVTPYQNEIDAILGLENDEALYKCILALAKYTRPAHGSEDSNWLYLDEPIASFKVIPMFKFTLAQLFTEKKMQKYKTEYNRIQTEECEEKNNEWMHRQTGIRLGPTKFVRASNEYDYVNGDLEDADDEDEDSGVDEDEQKSETDDNAVQQAAPEEEEWDDEDDEEEELTTGPVKRGPAALGSAALGSAVPKSAALGPAPLGPAPLAKDEAKEAEMWSTKKMTLKAATVSFNTYEYINYSTQLKEVAFHLLPSEKMHLFEIIDYSKKKLKENKDPNAEKLLWYRNMVVNGIINAKKITGTDLKQQLVTAYNSKFNPANSSESNIDLNMIAIIHKKYFVDAEKGTEIARDTKTTTVAGTNWAQFKPPLKSLAATTKTPAMPLQNTPEILRHFSFKILSHIEESIKGNKLILERHFLQNACCENKKPYLTDTGVVLQKQAMALSQDLQKKWVTMHTPFYRVKAAAVQSNEIQAEELVDFSDETKLKYISYQCSLETPFPPKQGSENFMNIEFGSTNKINLPDAEKVKATLPKFALLLQDINKENLVELAQVPSVKNLPDLQSDEDLKIYVYVIFLLNGQLQANEKDLKKINNIIAEKNASLFQKLGQLFPQGKLENSNFLERIKAIAKSTSPRSSLYNRAQSIISAVKFITRQLPNLIYSSVSPDRIQDPKKVPNHWRLQKDTTSKYILDKMVTVENNLKPLLAAVDDVDIELFLTNTNHICVLAEYLMASPFFLNFQEQFYTYILYDAIYSLHLSKMDAIIPQIIDLLYEDYLLPPTSTVNTSYEQLVDKINQQKEHDKEKYLQKRNKRTVEEIQIEKSMKKIQLRFDATRNEHAED